MPGDADYDGLVSPRAGRDSNFTFEPEAYVDACDDLTMARLRRAIRTYDPDGVMAIGHVLTS